MTLQQSKPTQTAHVSSSNTPLLCHKCGNPVKFDEDHVAPSGRKIPLDPRFNKEPHAQHCTYADSNNQDSYTESLLLDFLSKVPRKKRVIGAVGRTRG